MALTASIPCKCRGFAAACAVLPMLALAQENPLARAPAAAPAASLTGLNGRWNGAHIEQRSACTTPTNSGFHGTYAEYIYDVDPGNSVMSLTENAVNGLHCNYFGPVSGTTWSGEVSCTDGRGGTYRSQGIVITANEISVRLHVRLTGSETCDIDAILGGSRF
jgi:hypothetical protein